MNNNIMKKRFSFKMIVFTIIISLVALPIWASTELPENTINNAETPPDSTAPIDNYILLAMFICIVFVGYFFHKLNKSISEESS
jgi:hypothetical protein